MDGFREFKADPQGYWDRQLNAEFDAHILHLRDRLQRAKPHAGHYALARLVRDGWVRSVVTQNIDGLDARAGLAADRLIEIHGNRKRLRCIECGARTDLADFVPLFAPGPCSDCGGAVKFDAVMFGEPLVAEVLAAARAEFDRADCVLAIGTSATVRPASGLIWVATHRRDTEGQNAALVEINRNPTKATAISDIVVRAEAGVALPLLAEAVGGANSNPARLRRWRYPIEWYGPRLGSARRCSQGRSRRETNPDATKVPFAHVVVRTGLADVIAVRGA